MNVFRAFVKFLFVLCLLILLFAYAMFQGGFVSWFLFYSVATVIAFTAFVAFFPLRVKKVERIVSRRFFQADDEIDVKIVIHKRRFQPFFFVRIEDEIPERIGKASGDALFFFSFQRELTYRYTIKNAKRGVHHFKQLTLSFSDFFGWLERHSTLRCETIVYVYPQVRKLTLPVLGEGVKERGLQGKQSFDEVERSVSSIRQYIPGDRITSIDWKQSARSSRLMTKEFESYQGEDVMIVFDPYERIEDEHYFEQVVELAASVMAAAIEQKDSIRLAARFEDWLTVPITKNTLTDGLRLLAKIKRLHTPINLDNMTVYEWRGAQVHFICAQLSEQLLEVSTTLQKEKTTMIIYLLEKEPNQHDPRFIKELEEKGIGLFRVVID